MSNKEDLDLLNEIRAFCVLNLPKLLKYGSFPNHVRISVEGETCVNCKISMRFDGLKSNIYGTENKNWFSVYIETEEHPMIRQASLDISNVRISKRICGEANYESIIAIAEIVLGYVAIMNDNIKQSISGLSNDIKKGEPA